MSDFLCDVIGFCFAVSVMLAVERYDEWRRNKEQIEDEEQRAERKELEPWIIPFPRKRGRYDAL